MKKFYIKLKATLLVVVLTMVGALTASAADLSLDISVSNVTKTNAYFTITPSSDDLTYFWKFMTKAKFDANGGAEKVVENAIEQWKYSASWYDDTTWQEMMSYDLKTGVKEVDAADWEGSALNAATTYVVYAVGMDAEGNAITPVAVKEFTTEAAEQSSNTFEVKVDELLPDIVEYMQANVTVTPSNSDTYTAICMAREYTDKAGEPGSAEEKQFISDNILYYLTAEKVKSDTATFNFTRLEKDKEYCVVVMGIDADGAQTTPLTKYYFVCEQPQLQTIKIEVTDVTPMNAHIKITPPNDQMRYYFDVAPRSIVEQKGGVEKIPQELIIEWWKYIASLYGDTDWTYFIELQTVTGSIDAMAKDLDEEGRMSTLYWDDDWVLYAVGFDLNGNILTETAIAEFHTPNPPTRDLTFEFEPVSMEKSPNYDSWFQATVDIYPSDPDTPFMMGYCRTVIYDQYDPENPANMLDFVKQIRDNDAIVTTDAARLVMPNLYVNEYGAGLQDYYVTAWGWEEGPTTPIALYKFNYSTETGISLTKVEPELVQGGKGKIRIAGGCEGAVIYNMQGKVAGAVRENGVVNVPAGVYVVKYKHDGKTATKKVLVK